MKYWYSKLQLMPFGTIRHARFLRMINFMGNLLYLFLCQQA